MQCAQNKLPSPSLAEVTLGPPTTDSTPAQQANRACLLHKAFTCPPSHQSLTTKKPSNSTQSA